MGVFRDLFGWPGTWGTGGNLVAWIICGALGVAFAYLFRDLIGRRLAAWWHKHHAPHLRAELGAMEQRLRESADAWHEAQMAQERAHHEALKQHITQTAASRKAAK